MNQPSTVWSSVGKKILTGLTGLGLVLFVVVHLAGNLTFLMGSEAVNTYAHFLETIGHGVALPIAEVSLVLLFLLHIVSALTVYNDKNKARPVPYYKVANAGGKSRKTVSSQNMIWTGLLLLVFVCIHVAQFRLGAWYDTVEGGVPMRNLYKLVQETFAQPGWVVYYVAMMVLLGLHLRHGVWSMLQSLGLNNKRLSPALFTLSLVAGVVLALGFIILPIYLFSQAGPPPVGGLAP